jgi:3,4-dihydroxy 2-butanone 4-phosphate synthase/GTP cyclohydrolase II
MSQALIEEKGKGIIIWLDQEGKGNGHLVLIKSIPFKNAGLAQADAYVEAGFEADARNYRAAAEILSDLKVKSIVLLSNSLEKAEDLRRISISVSDTRRLYSADDK